jgi:hypothetical protein
MEALIALGVSLVLSVPLAFWRAFVFIKLWAWFAIPIFGLPALGLAAAMGLSILIGFLVVSAPMNDKKHEYGEIIAHQVVTGTLLPLFALLFGWVIHFFM